MPTDSQQPLARYERVVGAEAPPPPVVLVHGSMDRAAGMAPLARALPDLEVVRYDRRGYGRSPRPDPGVSVEAHVADLLAVVGDRPSLVVGHSFGGLVALAAAARQPARVVGVVAYEPPLPWLAWWGQGMAGGAALGAAMAEGSDAAADAFLRLVLGSDRWDALPERTREARRREGAALVAEIASARAGPVVDLDAVRAPVLAVHGARAADRHRRGTRLVAEQVPVAEVVELADAGHDSHRTRPDALAALVADFHARLRSGGTAPVAR
ncbi:MAG: alpha/beta hydrolase [Acidimicrobiia bacterium]|nr:alpha/beta hydrolase [Acidimicrobiia bacterium]